MQQWPKWPRIASFCKFSGETTRSPFAVLACLKLFTRPVPKSKGRPCFSNMDLPSCPCICRHEKSHTFISHAAIVRHCNIIPQKHNIRSVRVGVTSLLLVCRNIADYRTMRYCGRYHWKHLSLVLNPFPSPLLPFPYRYPCSHSPPAWQTGQQWATVNGRFKRKTSFKPTLKLALNTGHIPSVM